jgi:Asp-tRNA(Asn)/Glu-tRNA(Gln) amidotransferase A subunit family amidase
VTTEATRSAVAARAAIRSGAWSVSGLTTAFLDRIAAENPRINALRDWDADLALATARDLDARRARGEDIGPLGGVTVVVKENCDTAGLACPAGLEFRKHHRPARDSWITARLRAAGAVILGTSISDPGAFGVRTAQVTHPADPRLTVGGSSGGSAAALAAKLCLGAIGTDTGGSIRIPSACCGTVGLKPTFGALPMQGIFPLVPSLDHVGPMARDVADTALMWEGLTGQPPALARRMASLGVDPDWLAEADPPIREGLVEVLTRLRGEGVAVREIRLPALDDVGRMHGQIFFAESAAWHLAHHPEDRDSYPKIAQDWFDLALKMPVAAYVAACRARELARRQVEAVLQQVDVILTPTLSVWRPARDAADLSLNGQPMDYVLALVRQTCLFDHTGHPALAMPIASLVPNMGEGMQLVGAAGSEANLLGFGHWLQGLTGQG